MEDKSAEKKNAENKGPENKNRVSDTKLTDAGKDSAKKKISSSPGTKEVLSGKASAGKKSASRLEQAKKRKQMDALLNKLLIGGAGIIVVLLMVLAVKKASAGLPKFPKEDQKAAETASELQDAENGQEKGDILPFEPHCTEETRPDNLIKSTAIMVDGQKLANVSDYQASEEISFDRGSAYTQMDGVITFRGNNFRDTASYGTAHMEENRFEEVWEIGTGSLSYDGRVWNGSGWTGQPLITSWPKDMRKNMNMHDWAKEQDNLTEVIYACLDGNVYFNELETGKETRPTLKLGYTFKGAGALDPRGYPILYLGAGYTSSKGKAHTFIVNLLDCSVMYTFGQSDPYADRNCSFYDSSPLVDAETDTLIWPAESGILYLVHLNTQWNPEDGALAIEPDRMVKWKYNGKRSGQKYWLGMEDSACIYQGYMFVADNGGHMMCLDLNKLELVWVQDVLDDTNCSPVLSVEDGHLYIYISTSFHLGWRSSKTATIPIWKLDAEDGSIVWQTDYECYTSDGVSGGVQSTAALGRNALDDYIYVTVAKTGGPGSGVLTCLRKDNGEIVWEHEAQYAWSSPVCVYNEDGSGNVLYACSNGKMYLLDGQTGEQLDAIVLSKNTIEASPAVYNDMVIIGIRGSKIYGIQLK